MDRDPYRFLHGEGVKDPAYPSRVDAFMLGCAAYASECESAAKELLDMFAD